MRTAPIVAALSAFALIVACSEEESTSPTCVAPDQEITTYYFEDGGWVTHASWDASFLGDEVRIWLDIANYIREYSAFWATLDNVYAYGDLYTPEGLIDDFNDGVISPIWEGSGESCRMGRGAEACEANGVLTVVIGEGPDELSGEFRLAGLVSQDFVAHGEFDVQVDFTVNPEFHQTPETRVMLAIEDDNGRFPAMILHNTGYSSRNILGPNSDTLMRSTSADHLAGKLRITRTTCPG